MNPWVTLIIVAITYFGIAIGHWPRLKTNRTTIALMGAGLQKASLLQTAAGAGLFLVSVGIMALAARRIRARAGGGGDD